MLRRTLSLFLALIMVFGMVPTAALATEETIPETVAETVEVVLETTEAEEETVPAPAETTEAEEETVPAPVETTEAVEETVPAETVEEVEETVPVETTEAVEETTPATEETVDSQEAQMEAALELARAATSGVCGENLTWAIAGGTLTISGTGNMTDYATDNLILGLEYAPWLLSDASFDEIVIEDGVTSIGAGAFMGQEGVTSVTLPASLRTVGAYAFSGCIGLTEVSFSEGLEIIADYAFADCDALMLWLPATTAFVAETAFAFTTGAVVVEYAGTEEQWQTVCPGDLGENVTVNCSVETPPEEEIVEEGTTSNGLSWTLTNTGKLIIEGDADTIPAGAFANRTDIIGVVLPETVTAIGEGAFSGCTELEGINLDNVTDLDKDCFKDCKNLVIIDLSVNPKTITTQITELTYDVDKLPAAFDPSTFRWELISTTAADYTELDETTGVLHMTNKAELTVRCVDTYTGAESYWNMTSVYVPLIVVPELAEDSPAAAKKLTENAEPAANDKQLSKYAVYLDKEDVASGTYTFDIHVTCADPDLDLSNIKFTSTNAKVASVKGNTVTVKKKADGAAVILAQVMEGKKTVLAEGMLSVYVREYTPRLEATALTLNTLTTDKAVSTGLVESYGNVIKSVKLEGTDALDASWEDGILTVKATGDLPKTTNAKLVVTCHNEEMDLEKDYTFSLKVSVKNTAPAVTTKQAGKFDLFYMASTAQMTVTAKNAKVLDVAMEAGDFAVKSFDPETGIAVIGYSDTYAGGKVKNKANLLVTLDGYSEPVKKAVTIAAVTSKPNVVMTPSASVINTALNENDPSAHFVIYDVSDYKNLMEYVTDVTCAKDFATYEKVNVENPDSADAGIRLTLTGKAGGTATVTVKRPEWTQSITLTHKVTVNNKTPKVKLAASTITLDPNFPGRSWGVQAYLDQENLDLDVISGFTATGKNAAEAEKLMLTYEPGINVIFAAFRDPENLPEDGTYTFTAVPKLAANATLTEGQELAPITFKVVVAKTAPSVKLSASSVKLNKALSGEEMVLTTKVTKNNDLQLVRFDADQEIDGVELVFDKDTQTLSVKVDKNAEAGKYTLYLQPVFEAHTGDQAAAGRTVKLTVQVYDTTKVVVTMAGKGKLDAIVPESAITYTVNKISNAMGKLEGVQCIDPVTKEEHALFEVSELTMDAKGKQTFQLTMKPGVTFNTKTAYKVSFLMRIGGIEVEAPAKPVTVKVTQSKLKFSILPKIARYYQSQKGELDVTITLTAPEGAALDRNSIQINAAKTNAAFIRALGNGNTIVNTGELKVKKIYEKNGQVCADLSFDIRNSGHLTPGKSFPVVLDIAPRGNAENVAPAQLKITVKSFK